MLNVFVRRATPWACAWLLGLSTAHAAEIAPPERGASAPFKQYQGWRDEPLLDWREANERVGAIGGWRTYLRESQQDGEGEADRGGHGDRRHQGH